MKVKRFFTLMILLVVMTFPLSTKVEQGYKTENVIIAVMDGVQWTSTFGDPEHKYIPKMWKEFPPRGTLYTNFYNNDVTVTRAAHSTMATGTWQKNRNRGPRHTMPTIFNYIRDELKLPEEKVWVIFGKGNYAYDPTTSFPAYQGKFKPSFKIGIGESSLKYDLDVYQKVLRVMEEHQPKLIFANFGATDHLAHSGIWERHTKAIRHQDELFVKLWKKIQADTHYKDKTTLILLNDHGLQDDGLFEGFAEHGSLDEGCRHVMFLILGPDIKKGTIIEKAAYLIDIAPTVGELLGFQTPLAHGEVLKESLVKYLGLNRKEARTKIAKNAVRIEEIARKDLVKLLADKVIKKYKNKAGSLDINPDTAILLWGMLSAYDKKKDERYLNFVRTWAEKNLEASGENAGYAGLVLSELIYRLRDVKERIKFLNASKKIADRVTPELERFTSKGKAKEFALQLIFLSSFAEAAKDRELVLKTKDIVMRHLKSLDLEVAEAYIAGLRDLPKEYKKEDERVEEGGKVLPTSATIQGIPDNSWFLLALSFIRSHGLPFKGEFFRDVPGLRAESILQTYFAVKDLPGTGEIWPAPLQAAINITAIKEFMRRKDLYKNMEDLTYSDLVRIRPDSPELLPRLDKIKSIIGSTTYRTNYNVEYGLPPYKDIDYTVDFLRLYVEKAKDNMTIGAFLLALDPMRRIPYEPAFPSPRK